MNKPRIEPLPLPLDEEIQQIMDKIFPKELPTPELYRTVARNKELWKNMVDQGIIGPTGLFDKKRLDPKLRETIILRTCTAAGNNYEFNLHVQTISRFMGLSIAQIEDIRNESPDPSLWGDDELNLMKLIDTLVQRIEVDDDVFNSVHQYSDEPVLIEITNLVGQYTGVAMIVALSQPRYDNYEPYFRKAEKNEK